jgi:hypothetical protein
MDGQERFRIKGIATLKQFANGKGVRKKNS